MGSKKGEQKYFCKKDKKKMMFSGQQGGWEEQAMGNQEALVDGRTDHRELCARATD